MKMMKLLVQSFHGINKYLNFERGFMDIKQLLYFSFICDISTQSALSPFQSKAVKYVCVFIYKQIHVANFYPYLPMDFLCLQDDS